MSVKQYLAEGMIEIPFSMKIDATSHDEVDTKVQSLIRAGLKEAGIKVGDMSVWTESVEQTSYYEDTDAAY